MPITLGGQCLQAGGRLDIKVGEFGFVLIMKPISDDERIADRALFSRYWNETDPILVARWFAALDELRKSTIEGWEGVNDPAGNPVKYSLETLAILLRIPGARTAVTEAVRDYFDASGVDPKALGESVKQPSNTSPGETGQQQPTTSSSTSEGSERVNSQ